MADLFDDLNRPDWGLRPRGSLRTAELAMGHVFGMGRPLLQSLAIDGSSPTPRYNPVLEARQNRLARRSQTEHRYLAERSTDFTSLVIAESNNRPTLLGMLRVGIRPNRSTRVQASGHELNPQLLVGVVVFFATRALVTGVPRSKHMDYALSNAA
jgi:hypothetical protein